MVDLTEKGKTKAVKQQNGANYTVVFTINADVPPPPPPAPVVAKRVEAPVYTPRPSEPARNPFKSQNDRLTAVTSSNTVTRPAVSARRTPVSGDKVIIAIDAGHGGQDPGAIGPGGTREKNVTIAIARKLRALLNDDPMFKGVMTRDGDYFISVMGRSDVARKQNANFRCRFTRMLRRTVTPPARRYGCCRTVEPTVKWRTGLKSTRSNLNC